MVRRHKHINKILQRNNNTRNRARMEARTEDAQLANPVASAIPQEFHGRSKQRERQTFRCRRKNTARRCMRFEAKRLGHGRAFQFRASNRAYCGQFELSYQLLPETSTLLR
jgi:hypothetical protein